MSAPDRDLDKLDPTFRERVDELLRRLHAAKHDVMVWEAHRSFERARELEARGTGVERSMHCYRIAVDIVKREAPHWDAPPAMWWAICNEAEALGLTAGKRFVSKRRPLGDQPHVQALPASDDDWVRTATPVEIAERVAQHLDATDPARRTTVRESVRTKAKP